VTGTGHGGREPGHPRTADVLHAFKWSLLGEATSRLIGPAVFLVLARLLTPEDFGVVAAATVVISLSQALADAGLGKALVQRREAIELGADAAFWLSLGLSVLLALALFAGADAIAAFFGEPRVAAVVRVLSVQVPLTALAAVPTALLQRDLAFRELFWVRLLTAGLPALASIPMALAGMGFWALVAGAVAGQALQCAVLWGRSHWRPHARLDAATAAQLLRFGRWTAASAVLAWGYAWLDALIVARWLGTHDVGLYRIATTFVTMFFGLAFAPLLPVLYSLFSHSGHRPDRVAAALHATARATVLVSLPTAALIVLLSTSAEARLFGPEWAGLAPLLALLAASQGLAWLVGANGEAYRAIGRPDYEVWAMGVSVVVYLAGYLLAIPHGLLVFVATRAALVLAGLALQVLIARRALGLSPWLWVAAVARPLAFSVLAGLAAWGAAAATAGTGVPAEAVLALVFLATYLALLLAFDRRTLRDLRNTLHGP
jgi:O-antigen/teichoic acid export membrane protein